MDPGWTLLRGEPHTGEITAELVARSVLATTRMSAFLVSNRGRLDREAGVAAQLCTVIQSGCHHKTQGMPMGARRVLSYCEVQSSSFNEPAGTPIESVVK